MPTPQLSRRTLLRSSAVALALPLLEMMQARSFAAGATSPALPRRMVLMMTTLGINPESFFPDAPGRNYPLSPYLKVLEPLRNDFTVLSGVSHPDVDGGHTAEASYLTAAPHPGSNSFRNTISLDQFAAEKIGSDTRFPSLTLGLRSGISFSRSGTPVPAEKSPSAMFSRLFFNGSPAQVKQQVQRIKDGQSIMDTVLDQTKTLQAQVSAEDRRRLDEYFTSVREVEVRMTRAEEWSKKPKPKVAVAPPIDIKNEADLIGRTRLMYDLIHLAVQTDSTRIITMSVNCGGAAPFVPGVTMEHHNLSHHGKDPEKLAQLRLIETAQMQALRDLLLKLRQTPEQGRSLLDGTMVLYGSNLGNSSSHSTKNMPVLLAGGGFRHGQHLAFDRDNNTPLCKLYVSMLQQLGLEIDTFASGKGRITGLDAA